MSNNFGGDFRLTGQSGLENKIAVVEKKIEANRVISARGGVPNDDSFDDMAVDYTDFNPNAKM